jgi:hypothetical protein
MKLSSLTLAAAIALAGSAAFADTTVNKTVSVGPNGEVTHVVRQTTRPDGSTRTVHKTRKVSTVTTPVVVAHPVVVHRKVVYHSPEWYRIHRHHRDHVAYRHGRHDGYAFTRHGEVHYAHSVRPAHNNS